MRRACIRCPSDVSRSVLPTLHRTVNKAQLKSIKISNALLHHRISALSGRRCTVCVFSALESQTGIGKARPGGQSLENASYRFNGNTLAAGAKNCTRLTKQSVRRMEKEERVGGRTTYVRALCFLALLSAVVSAGNAGTVIGCACVDAITRVYCLMFVDNVPIALVYFKKLRTLPL